ncbi:MAG: LytTR family DNA-binding domain-containing protein [Bacteroidota bacterium]
MEVVIIEDEDLAAEKLIDLLDQIDPQIEVVAQLKSVEEAVEWLNLNNVDLLFVDINLADDVSFKIFQRVKINTPIIFTTAYDEFAVRAFEENSIAYLLKPLDKELLEKALNKYHRMKSRFDENIYKLLEKISGDNSNKAKQRITVNYSGKMRSIAIKDIAVFYIIKGMSYLKTFDGTKYVLDQTLDSVYANLSNTFFRATRKHIVNIEAIDEVIPLSSRKLKIKMHVDVPEEILVSSEKITLFKNWFNNAG